MTMLLEFSAEFLEIVDLAVEDDLEMPVGRCHRLMPPRGEIDDGKSSMPEAYGTVFGDPSSGIVGAAVSLCVTKSFQLVFGDGLFAHALRACQDSADSAHRRHPRRFRFDARYSRGFMKESPPSLLLGLTGLNIDGGIAVVSRCIARALNESIAGGQVARADRVLLLDEPELAPPRPRRGEQYLGRGSKIRFVYRLWLSYLRGRPDLVFFDLTGLARSVHLPLPGFPPTRYAIFAHGEELEGAEHDSRGRAVRRAWRVLANSEFTGERLRTQFPEIADRIRVTPLCIDPARVELWESISESRMKPEAPIALIVGRMWAEERGKGHDQLLDIWPDVDRRIPGATLWVVGVGDDVGRLEEKARNLGVADRVRFFGRVTDEELCDLYRRAAVFAMPSRQEGFGLVYAEAMWHGLPCIGSYADAAGQVISDGETGLLGPYDDRPALGEALVRILEDSDYCARLGEASAKRARDYFGYERFKKDVLRALEIVP
jgi:phosphatidylinositol alpha-1,6-mannosyltransferase